LTSGGDGGGRVLAVHKKVSTLIPPALLICTGAFEERAFLMYYYVPFMLGELGSRKMQGNEHFLVEN
jgi:hypothetical protein